MNEVRKQSKLGTDVTYFFAVMVVCFLTVLACGLVTSCQGQYPTDPVTNPGPGPGDGDGDEDSDDKPSPRPLQGIDYGYIAGRALQPFCISCHNADFPIGGVDLTNYEGAKKLGDKLCNIVKSGKMPPAEPLPPELVKKLCEWVSSGSPQYSPSVEFTSDLLSDEP